MTTNVPKPAFTDTGFVPPTELAVLAGVQQDWDAAFGAPLNFGSPINPTPQGQIASSEAACIGDANNMFCALANGVDPAYASGRMQDAIGRIYFMTRLPAQSTIASCVCLGLSGTIIPQGALAIAEDGNLYYAVDGGVIPIGGSITLNFACQITGPIPCAADTVNRVYRTIPGWDSINNPTDGVLGNFVESRQAFEVRRQLSVALNTVGFNTSVYGAVLDVDGVLDASVTDNPNSFPVGFTPDAVVSGSISGTTLTVDSLISGTIAVGQTVTGSSASNVPVANNTTIVSFISGDDWEVSVSQTVALSEMNLGGVVLGPNCLYVAAVGGTDLDVATAAWSKKSPGCPWYDGNTTVTVYDTNVQAPPPGQAYTVVFERPESLPFVFKIRLANNVGIPNNATALIQAAVIAAFAGADDGQRARIGYPVFASRFYAPVAALGTWANIISILIGTPNLPTAVATGSMGASFTGAATGASLVVTSVTGYISVGDLVSGTGVPTGTTILSQDSGTTGGAGTYTTSVATTATAAALTTQSTVVNVASVASGALAAGQFMFDPAGNIDEGTKITAQLTGTPGAAGLYSTSVRQRVPSQSFNAVVADQTLANVAIDQAPTLTAGCIEVEIVG